MRRAHNPAITAKMYRHFAVVTVLITVTVAVFANGEKQQAIAAEAAADHPKPVAKKDKTASPTANSAANGDSGTWGSDDSDFGRPSALSGWADGSFGSDANLAHPFTSEDENGSDDGDGDVSARSALGSGDSGPPTAAQIAAIEAASRVRSGSPDSD